MMKLAVICLFSIVFCLAADFSSAQGRYNFRVGRNTNVNWRGINHRSNNGRHNTNLNYRNARYNYRGNRWNTNVNHAFRNSHTNLNANYRRNHNFGAGYNWRNRQANVGYRYNFGKRSIDSEDEVAQFLELENKPSDFLGKLQFAVDEFIKAYQSAVPELDVLSIPVPDGPITNVTVAQELVCVVKKLQRILPTTLGNFIVKMIKFHADDFGIEGLKDFFNVDGEDVTGDICEVPEVPASSESVDSGTIYEMKKFVATVIAVAMEYQQYLEE